MKRHKGLLILLTVFIMGATAQAQSPTLNPQELGPQQRLNLESVIEQYFNALGGAQQRGGARGTAPVARGGPIGASTSTAWWTNTALVARLGLTDDQKAKIETAFENHRQNLVSSKELLEKEEAELARLLAAESIDRNAALAQIDRVIQARGEMERTNAAMTLEMRQSLTRAQWLQLQAQPGVDWITAPVPAGAGARGGQRRGPGQQ